MTSTRIELQPNSSPSYHERQHSMPEGGALYWYEEETVEPEEEEGEMDFTEVTYESECPTEDDILLGTLPPAPPLSERNDFLTRGNFSDVEQKLLEAMRSKRDEQGKTFVPGTGRKEQQPLASKQELFLSQAPLQRKALQHFSPTGVWDLHHNDEQKGEESSSSSAITPRRTVVTISPRLQKIDEILLRSNERRAFSPASADPHQQKASLQKFWQERIEHQLCSLQRQLAPLEHGLMRTEKQLALLRRKQKQQQQQESATQKVN